MFKKFDEFVAAKNQMPGSGKDLGPKPKIQDVPDYDGPVPKAPTAGGNPYVAPGGAVSAAKSQPNIKAGEGLASKDGGGGVYKPGVSKGKAAGAPYLKVKGENFIAQTSKMSPKEFREFMTSKGNLGFVSETVTAAGRMMRENPSSIRSLVREAKRNGTFNALFQACLEQPEAFSEIANLLGSKDGERASRRLVRALDEAVAPPGHDAGPLLKKKMLPPPGHGGGMGPGDDDQDPDDPHGLGGIGGDDDQDDDGDPFGGGGDEDDDHGHDDQDSDDDGDMDDDSSDDGDDYDPDSDDDLDDDDSGDDDEDSDGGDGDDDDPHGMDGGDDDDDPMKDPLDDGGDDDPHGKGGPPPFPPKKPGKPDGPRASMMHRMMSREHTSAAAKNFFKALQD